MLISKSYLKQVIKEETEKIFNNKETEIQMSPSEYLNLTTHEVHFPLTDIIKRYEFRVNKIAERLKKEGIDSDKAVYMAKQEIANGLEQAKMPALVINKDGKVVNHEGRLRSYYYGFIKQPKKEKIPVTLIHPANVEVKGADLILKNQFDDDKSITLNQEKNIKSLDLDSLKKINNVEQSRLSGIFREIVSNLIKQNQISTDDAVNFLNKELKNYNVILDPPRDEGYSVLCTLKPTISARIFKTNFNPESKLNNPESNLFQNPISWKDKISLKKE